MTAIAQPIFNAQKATDKVVLQATNITLGYAHAQGYNTVLQDFSTELKAGEIIALLGPSGVGKSSLLRVLAGMRKPQQGRVDIHGKHLLRPHPRLSFMFQDPSLLPWLNLEDNVGFGLDFKHQIKLSKAEKRERIAQAIHEVQLDHALGLYPRELSGGMAQRVALARSLARQPEILLLDEPFSALDELTRSEMQQLLRSITRRHNTAAVLVTHDIDEALLLADRVLLIGGRPGRLLNEWHIDLPHPRHDEISQLGAIRIEILQHMRDIRTSQIELENAS